jgi:hypothetical protein
MARKIHVVFWVMTLYSEVVGYQHFKRAILPLHPEDGGSMFL